MAGLPTESSTSLVCLMTIPAGEWAWLLVVYEVEFPGSY